MQVVTYNADNNNSFIDAYIKLPMDMEKFPLIYVAKLWSYDKLRQRDTWLPLNNATIAHAFPLFNSIPAGEDDKFVEFCWYEL